MPAAVPAALVGGEVWTSSAATNDRNTLVPEREDPSCDAYRELTGMGTCVRDCRGFGLHTFPPSPRPRERLRGARPRLSSSSFRWAEALELTLLLADDEPEKYERAAARWHLRFAQEVPHVDARESLAVLALLVTIPANRLAAAALAELLARRRSCERIAVALVRWAREA